MGLFNKKPDPITDRSRELNAKIAALESKIKKLNQELQPGAVAQPREAAAPAPAPAPTPGISSGEPVFEKVDQNRLQAPAETPASAHHFNELGVRKYDLWSLLERIRKQFQGPPAANPKLVNYLAAGSIQGLRPLRYEKRVAHNRFVALLAIFGLLCCLILSYACSHHH